ncbi:MAG: Dabb family protein [Verrucomicrobiota bacterium JB023]|nr:Dabb family protein [Verrucomicrobiota bacterium JB023]
MEHHVYFWLKPECKDDATRSKFERGLAALFEIEAVAGGIWGHPAATPERPVTEKSWDYALSLRFDSLESHDAYQEDPAHDAFVDEFKDCWAKAQVMDVSKG